MKNNGIGKNFIVSFNSEVSYDIWCGYFMDKIVFSTTDINKIFNVDNKFYEFINLSKKDFFSINSGAIKINVITWNGFDLVIKNLKDKLLAKKLREFVGDIVVPELNKMKRIING